jgi:hypothetical protein
MTPGDVTPEARKKFAQEAEENKDMDFLNVDSTIPGQSWVCLSFLSPEAIIKQRHLFYFQTFLRSLTEKLDLPPELELSHTTKLEELVQKGIDYQTVNNAWEDFLHVNGDKLSQKFEEETNGRTSIRGLKIRGCYATWQEAKNRSDRLAELDKSHHVYIGQVGYWLPWDPDPSEVPEQEYQKFYEERKREKLREAMERNRKKKEENKATETKEPVGQTSEDLERVRKIVQEKNKVLQDSLDRKKKAEDEKLLEAAKTSKTKKKKKSRKPKKKASKTKKPELEPVQESDDNPDTNATSSVAEEVQNVFNAEDPWLNRQKDKKKDKK